MSTTALVIGVAAARRSLGELDGFDEVVVLDPRFDYLLGGLPVLPLPDASVDLLVGADAADPEVARVLRPGGRVLPAE